MNSEAQLADHAARIKSLEKRTAKLEEVTESINKMAVSMEHMSTVQTQMLEEQKEMKENVANLMLEPAKTARDLKNKLAYQIISLVVAAIVGAILALIIK